MPDGVTQRKDGRFLFRKTVYGVPHYIYADDLTELKKKIIDFEHNRANEKPVKTSNICLDLWYRQYMEVYKRKKLKESTFCNQLNYYAWYIEGSELGKTPIKKIIRTQVVVYFQKLQDKKNLSSGTLKLLANILYQCLQTCVYDGLIATNPAEKIMEEIKETEKQERNALSVEETKVLIEFLKLEGWQNIYLSIIGIGLSTGMRFGELSGLTWRDVDLKKKSISIKHTLNYRSRENGKHEFYITTPKTASSVRKLEMTDEMEKLFQIQKEYQENMGIESVEIDGYSNFVFTTKTGLPFTNEAIVRSLKNIIKQANDWEKDRAKKEKRKAIEIPIHTPHVWRHTLTTRLVEKEIPYERLKAILGHRSIRTTIDIYSHVSENLSKKVKTDLEGVVNIW